MMKKRLLVSVLAFAMAAAPFTGYGPGLRPAGDANLVQAREKASETSKKDAMQPVQQFGYELMGQYLSEDNPVMSPVSAYVMLGMAGNGAKGTTKKQFQKVLGSNMLSISKDLMDTLSYNNDGMQIKMANSAWMDHAFTPKKNWQETAQKQLQSEVFQVDLDTNAAKNKINKWVSERTNKLIPKLLDQKLEEATRLALVNALYFHADWQQKFVPEFTRESDFKLDSGKNVKADMMHATMNNSGYFKDSASEGVVLPYKDSQFAFVAVKPSGTESIRDWYASYSAEKLAALVESSKTEKVQLSLPKFQVRCRKQLNDSLKKMGLKKAFDVEKADFSLIGKSADEGNLYLSFVLQEAVISVAEDGTEAAAATIGGIAAGSAAVPEKPVAVDFDRSFLYMVMDMESGVPVFMGIMDQP